MTGFQLSFGTGVGPAIANHLWQSTVFATVAWLMTLLLRKNRAQLRYGLWLMAFGKVSNSLLAVDRAGQHIVPAAQRYHRNTAGLVLRGGCRGSTVLRPSDVAGHFHGAWCGLGRVPLCVAVSGTRGGVALRSDDGVARLVCALAAGFRDPSQGGADGGWARANDTAPVA